MQQTQEQPFFLFFGYLRWQESIASICGTEFVVFDEITPDAPIPLVEAGIALYQRAGCDAIVAFGQRNAQRSCGR